MKKCSICGCQKDVEEFRIRDKKTGLRRNECADCTRKRHKLWRDGHPGVNRRYYDKQYERTRIRLCTECGERYRAAGTIKYCSLKCFVKGKTKILENGCWEWQG